jgi:hypothetical protein
MTASPCHQAFQPGCFSTKNSGSLDLTVSKLRPQHAEFAPVCPGLSMPREQFPSPPIQPPLSQTVSEGHNSNQFPARWGEILSSGPRGGAAVSFPIPASAWSNSCPFRATQVPNSALPKQGALRAHPSKPQQHKGHACPSLDFRKQQADNEAYSTMGMDVAIWSHFGPPRGGRAPCVRCARE